jgi:hypothetical protein
LKLDAVARPQQRPGGDHPIDDPPQLLVRQREGLPPAMRRRPGRLRGAHLGNERVDANVRAQRRPSLVAAQSGEQTTLREPSLAGVDRSVAHGRDGLSPG